MSPRKILQVFNRYQGRGGEEISVDQIYSHASRVFEVERYIRDSADWSGPNAPGRLVQLRKLFYNKQTLKDLDQYSRPDVVLTHNLYPVISPALFDYCRANNLPVIQFIHNFRPFSVGGSCWTKAGVCDDALRGNLWPEIWASSWQESKLKSMIMALMLKRLLTSGRLEQVKCWIGVSDFMRDKFIEAGLPKDRVVSLRCSWDAMREVPDTCDDGYYLMLARLVPEKGITTCLEAWEAMPKDGPKLIIGGDGPLSQKVRQAANRCERIEYVGFVDKEKKADLLRRCRAVLAPSVWWEPLGLVTYEAYDYQKPMLAAASGGLAETVQDGVTGFLHKPGDILSLTSSVMKTELLSCAERHEFGVAGREWLLINASPERWKKSFEEIICGVCEM